MRPSKDPRATQETPKDLQHPMQKHAKKIRKNTLRGKKCLKPAISFLTISEPNFPSQNCTFLKHILNMAFVASPKKHASHVGTHCRIRAAKERQDEPKRTIISFKKLKTCFGKILKNTLFFKGFCHQGHLKKASREARRLPKGIQKSPRRLKMRIQF